MKNKILILFGICSLLTLPARAQFLRVDSGGTALSTNFWSTNAAAYMLQLVNRGMKTNAATASLDGWLSHTDWSTFDAKLTASETNKFPSTNYAGGVNLQNAGSLFSGAMGNFATLSNILGYIGSNITFFVDTNIVTFAGAGNTTNNVPHQWSIPLGLYTNEQYHSVWRFQNPTWFLTTQDGVNQYSSPSVAGASMTNVSGSVPPPTSSFGVSLVMSNLVMRGKILSTDFEQRLTTLASGLASTNLATLYNVNIASGNGGGLTNVNGTGGKVIYVEVNGNDANSGTNQLNALLTPSVALARATNGTVDSWVTVRLGAGTFNVSSLTNQNYCSLEGAGMRSTLIYAGYSGQSAGIKIQENCRLKGFYLTVTNGNRTVRGVLSTGYYTNVIFTDVGLDSPLGIDSLYVNPESADIKAYGCYFSSPFDSDIDTTTNGFERYNCSWFKDSTSEGNGVKINNGGIYKLIGGTITCQNGATGAVDRAIFVQGNNATVYAALDNITTGTTNGGTFYDLVITGNSNRVFIAHNCINPAKILNTGSGNIIDNTYVYNHNTAIPFTASSLNLSAVGTNFAFFATNGILNAFWTDGTNLYRKQIAP